MDSKITAVLYQIGDHDLVTNDGEKQYTLRIRDLPTEEKPREKLLKFGVSVLSVHELMALVLNSGTKKEGVLEMSKRLIKEYGENGLVNQIDPRKLAEALSISIIKACQLVATFELGRRFFKPTMGRAITIRTAKQAAEYVKDMHFLPKEHLRGLYLNNHYRLVHDEVISIGSVSANIVHPREVFRPALEYTASAIILAHNHPSNNALPSEADIKITQQIVQAGEIMGIDVLDHLIITKNKYISIPAHYHGN